MEFKELGKTRVTIPEIGLGTWQHEGGVEPIRKGIELGAFHIDTAENYGTEEAVGEAISGQRKKVFLATKVSGGHLRYDEVLVPRMEACEGWEQILSTSIRFIGRTPVCPSRIPCAPWRIWLTRGR